MARFRLGQRQSSLVQLRHSFGALHYASPQSSGSTSLDQVSGILRSSFSEMGEQKPRVARGPLVLR